MVTLGIDLSAESSRTAICLLEWSGDRFSVATDGLRKGNAKCPLDIAELVALSGEADWVGIDAPFGWPSKFVESVRSWKEFKRDAFSDPRSREYQLRRTDLQFDLDGLVPLSVSSDRLCVTAMKCSVILDRIGLTDRSGCKGGSRVVEVYPAGALRNWGLPHQGYKKGDGKAKRVKLVDRLIEKLGPIHSLADLEIETLKSSDDCLDAFVASLVVRTRAKRRTSRPRTDEEKCDAIAEGWMHVPKKGLSLRDCVK